MFRSTFDKLLENATSHLHLEPDWPSILLISDEINQKDVNPKNAFAAIKKKMSSPNPHSAFYSLLVLESVVKNCGAPMHAEVFTKENCEMFSNFLEQTPHENVRQKMLELVQTWAYAFRASEKYQAIKDTMNILKAKGKTFPELKEADAMFTADTAPNWSDGKVCHRCRVEFSFTVRKHHCRNCGQVFCASCSTKQCPLPKYGIEKEVRVCDHCHDMLQRPASKSLTRPLDSDLPAEYLNSSLAQQIPPRKTEQELKEEEDLQLALALSQSEAEQKKQKTPQQQTVTAGVAYHMLQRSPSPEAPLGSKDFAQEDTNPDLAKYLNRSYWEQRKVIESPLASPSAPSPMATPQPQQQPMQPKTADEVEIDEFAGNMRTQLEIFVNRMKSNSSRGRCISNDSSVHSLFTTLTSLHSRQLSYIKDMDDKRMWCEQLQDKLAQIRDSRAALDVLRQEHVEKLRRMAEEQELQRQIQMAQKLEIMRKKKQEYLQYQRQLALQRIQEQEREMQMRQEQQKAQYRMGQNTAFPFISAGMGAHGSPSHQIPNAYGSYGGGFNPNSPGPISSGGKFNAIPNMYTTGIQQSMPPASQPIMNQHSGIFLTPPGMLPQNSAMISSVGCHMNDNCLPSNQALQRQQQHQPVIGAPPSQQHLQHQSTQLAHVLLQQQQSVIPTQSPMSPSMNAPQPQQQQQHIQPTASTQVQAVAAAPVPQQTDIEPQTAAASAPEEPATAELISFD